MAKIALLIGVSEYESGLDGLPSAINDVTAMRQVLTHPGMGEFADAAVTVLPNPSRQVMEDAIYNLFAHRQKNDLVLLYFSGHGVIDEGGEFYFASRFTRKEQGRLVPTTATAARSVCDWMEASRSQHKVIILDSCFSGAFAKGVKAKDSGSVNPAQFLGSKGTAILTASTSTQYALTQEGFDLSIYTHYLVEGIRTGGADHDDDGFIGMEELHTYASSKVREAAPAMTPEFYPVKEGYKILLAKSPKDDPQLRYRKAVRLLAEEDGGDFSFINRAYLEDLQRDLRLLPDEAAAIETEELEPYRQRRAKVDRYRTVFEGAIDKQYPLTERDRLGLQRLQQLLSLRDEDVVEIEAPLLGPKQAEYERQQLEQKGQSVQLASVTESKITAPEAPQVNGLPLLTVDFETVLVDGQGRVTQRPSYQAKFVIESLGNGIELELASIPAGSFQMGAPSTEIGSADDERPQHLVSLKAFLISKYAVTQAQWKAVAGLPQIKMPLEADPSNFTGNKLPVESVNWNEAVEFCARLSQKTGRKYRLPSEAEWEYACRAGTQTPFHFGETITSELANYDGNNTYSQGPRGVNRGKTTEVGSFKVANAYGLHDMHGNVREWCQDHWHSSYQDSPTDGRAWLAGGDSSVRVLRGGSWVNIPWWCRSACRLSLTPDYRFNWLGFRVVCDSPRTS
ncbi:MAG: SUMF1/EgtB/PvdO family nonheme iron enzyme [Thermosynechococcaceae cyanobacterium MS004]|nr:SUMF1/EgtB/PvdO family nonheme iron enzyme [Thermosynechococcaceae cyanobacterium MS004]